MCLMVLDVVHRYANAIDAEGVGEGGADVPDLSRILKALLQIACRRSVSDGAQQLSAQVRARIAGDRNVVEVVGRHAGVGKTPTCSKCGKPRAVLYAVEPLLLGGRDQLTIDDERCRSVPMIRVDAEDRRHGA